MVACRDCGQATFCSAHCERQARQDPAGHSPAVCRVLARLDIHGLSEESIVTLRFLVQAQALFMAAAHDDAARGRWAAFAGLTGAADSKARDSSDLFRRLSTATFSSQLPQLAGSRPFTPEEVAEAVAKEELNGYGIMAPSGPEGERRIRGTAIYPNASLINHECLPNVARMDNFDAPEVPAPNNTAVHFKALHDLPAGEEFTQSYFPLHVSYPVRQQRCQEQYGFVCTCPRCKEESTWPEDDEADSLGEEDTMEMEAEAEAASGEAEMMGEAEEGGEGANAGYIQVFLLKYVCPQADCFGTLVPTQPGSTVQECNMCGCRRTEAQFLADLEAAHSQDIMAAA
ncbi:probable histone-lysine N-methyltransferase SMYD1 [Coccomyxa sp. Obi]|nr:probable histone-lysine N-methyltransferase SMYD1 [Coccomyxa sp. Obi]